MSTLSRPQTPSMRGINMSIGMGTPSGISPRGSFVNISDAAEPGSPLLRSVSGGAPGGGGGVGVGFGDEKERARAEAEVREGLLRKEKEKEKEKEKVGETPVVVGSPVPPIVAYCLASIMMTVVNKFVVSGSQFTMTFLLLTIQSAVCVACVMTAKKIGVISFRDWDKQDARAWFPVSALLVAVIYTGSKSLQFLSIPVYTIFKNLTIILIAYGEVLWFGGSVSGLTLVSFFLMVGSSVIAAWADISTSLATASMAMTKGANGMAVIDPTSGAEVPLELALDGSGSVPIADVLGRVNVGYLWMFVNCVASAAYVLFMRKRIKVTGFKDWDSMYYNNLLSIPVLLASSLLVEDWTSASFARNFPAQGRSFLLAAITFSGAAAVFISYTTAWCVRVTGSTTYSMVGALNKLPVAASGILFFGDPANLGNVSAIAVGGVAGVVYAIAKTNQARIDKARAARAGGAGKA